MNSITRALLCCTMMISVLSAQEPPVSPESPLLQPGPVLPPPPPSGDPEPTSEPASTSSATEGAENAPVAGEMTEHLHNSIEHGLAYLSSQQVENGSFGRGRFADHVGITSLAAIAFMSDGHLPGRGTYGEHVTRALDFVLQHATETGLIAAKTSHGPMYGHGFATLFLGEIYGMTDRDARVRTALEKAVELIVRTQNDEGGWRYQPVPSDADISVTICEVMALRSARNAGIKVPESTIKRAIDYVKRCQNTDGGFRYMSRDGASAWPRTAAGVASLFYSGIHGGDAIEQGLDYLEKTAMPGRKGIRQSHYYYGQYYAVQAMYMAGGSRWEQWWLGVRRDLLARQSTNGGWLDHHVGGAYASSMSLIVLQMPKRYLPIFQR